jgi:peptide/nickel transport system substrate-binding protein
MLAAACGGGDEAPPEEEPGQAGGEIVLGAEQYPQCTNPITSCAAASWAFWSLFYHVLPRATELDLDGNYVAGPMLTEMPTVENGLITEDPFTVTFNLNPEAVWNDGSPITCEDIRFTSGAQINSRGSYSGGVGFDQIEEVDCSTEGTAVLRFKEPYAPWNELFGGGLGFVLQASAYKDAESDTANIARETLDELPYSGGPWVLDSWSKQRTVLVPNENFWVEDRIPLLDKVTIIPILDQAAEINAVLSGEVAAIFPQPSEVSIPDQVAGDPAVEVQGAFGVFNEHIWIQNQRPLLQDQAVREALAYAIDRESVISTIISVNQEGAEINNCPGTSFPHIGTWCKPVFEDITYDPAQSVEILEGAGWDCSGVPQSPCEKDGEPLSLVYSTVAGNTRREATQQLLKEQARPAGFDFQVQNYDATVLFSDIGPKGEYDIADYAIGGTPDPSPTANFGCDGVPSEENGFAGANFPRWCNEEADQLMRDSDAAVDPAQREELLHQVWDLFRQDVASIPLYVLPNVLVWRTDQVEGPIGEYTGHFYSGFYNMFDWTAVA